MAKPGRRRTLAQMDKDAQTLAYHLQCKTYREIMVLQGYKSAGTVSNAIKRAIADRQKDAFGQVEDFAVSVARLQRMIAKAEADLEKTYYVTSTTGKLVHGPDGRPLEDDAPKQRVRVEIRHLQEHLDKLQGNFAPAKVRQEVITQDVVDRENDQFAAEIERLSREMERGGEAADPGVIREP